MLRPVLVTPPAEKPVSLDEAKAHLRVDHDDDDALIQAYIDAAVTHLDGYSGILGRCLVEQTWRQDYPGWCLLRLPFPDARNVAVTYRNAAGTEQTVATEDYWLNGSVGGPDVRFLGAWSSPALLAGGAAPVSLTFSAGYGAAEDVPWALKAAILLHVGSFYATRETMAAGQMAPTMAYEALVAPFRVVTP